ncbi:MAG: hypothetical protein N2112_16300 [Gemmataceae bacterium]|nr:hypothetical protein [Gemmataceae bacterium]
MSTTDWTTTRSQLDEIDAILKRMLNSSDPQSASPSVPNGFSTAAIPSPPPVEHVPSWVSGMAPSVPSPYPSPLPAPVAPTPVGGASFVGSAPVGSTPVVPAPAYTPQPYPSATFSPDIFFPSSGSSVPLPYTPAPQVPLYTNQQNLPLPVPPSVPPLTSMTWADPVQAQHPTAAIVYESSPQYAETIPTPSAENPPPQPKTMSHPPTPSWLIPILIVNKVFDILLMLTGPFGAGLRTPSGKNFLGWLGLIMLIGAVLWVVGEWYGIQWPW